MTTDSNATRETWFRFGPSCLVRAGAIDFASLKGRDLAVTVNGVIQVISSDSVQAARERFDLIQEYAGSDVREAAQP